MRYDNSLTFQVQYYLETVITKKFAARENDWSLKSSAESFREFLCASKYVNSLDFVIRRNIQTKHPELLPCDVELADLTKNTNLPWDEEVIQILAQKLYELSDKQGAKIEKKEWLNYLSGTKGIRNREKAFMVAFTLDMTVEDAFDILLACDLEPYSARHPLDFICMFCQKRPGRYTWGQAEAMYEDFLSRRPVGYRTLNAPTSGMTAQLSADLEKIFGKDQGDEDARNELVQYMVDNAGEFPVYVKRVQRKDKTAESGYSYVDKEYFLPGYSKTRTAQYQRLSQYLAVLYPSYTRIKRKKSKTNDSVSGEEVVMVSMDEDGIPDLTQIVQSMLVNSELVAKEFDWDLSKFESGDEEYDATNLAFEKQMKKYWTNYLQHIMAVDRLLTKENTDSENDEKYQNYAYFRRNDILLFLYFLTAGYLKAFNDEDGAVLDAITELSTSGDEFDEAIDLMLQKVGYISAFLRDDQYGEKVDMIRECFDLILVPMDYKKLYLPSLFDRLFFSMLLCDDSHDLLRMVICQGEV